MHVGIHPHAQCMLGYTLPCPVHAGIHMATAADGTHPIGMHSCHNFFGDLLIGNDYLTSHTSQNISMLLVKRCESIIGSPFDV